MGVFQLSTKLVRCNKITVACTESIRIQLVLSIFLPKYGYKMLYSRTDLYWHIVKKKLTPL